jgi:carbon storage regulator
MLVLARKLGEGIHIGDEVRIVVVEIRSGRVRLGIEAPRHVRIRRDEIDLGPDEAPLEFEISAGMGDW